MLQTSTFQVVPFHHCLGMSGTGMWVPGAQEGLPSSDGCLSSTAMAFITYILVAGLALGTQDR